MPSLGSPSVQGHLSGWHSLPEQEMSSGFLCPQAQPDTPTIYPGRLQEKARDYPPKKGQYLPAPAPPPPMLVYDFFSLLLS